MPFDGQRSPAAEQHIAALQARVDYLQAHQVRQLLTGAVVALVVMAVVSLRRKLGKPSIITTTPGVGYRITPP